MSAKIGSLTEAIVAASAGTGSCLPNSSMTKGLFRDTASAARAEIQLFTKDFGSTPKVVLACTKEELKLSDWHTNGIAHQLHAFSSEQHVRILLWVSQQHVKVLMWVDAKHTMQQYPCKDSRSQAAAYLPVVCPNVCGSKVNAGRCVVLQEILTSLLSPSACQKLSSQFHTFGTHIPRHKNGNWCHRLYQATAANHIHFMTG